MGVDEKGVDEVVINRSRDWPVIVRTMCRICFSTSFRLNEGCLPQRGNWKGLFIFV